MRLIASLLILAACALPGLAPAQTSATLEARVIVRFKADADSVKARRVDLRMARAEVRDVAEFRAHGLGVRRGLAAALHGGRSLDVRTQVITARGMDSATLVRQLAKDAEVEFVAVDQRRRLAAVTPNDPLYAVGPGGQPAAGQWYLKAPSSDVVSSINATGAWDITKGASSVVVAVLDTGVLFGHEDLAGQFIRTTDTTTYPSGYVGYDMIGYGESGSAASIASANDGNGADGDASDPGDWVTSSDVSSGPLKSSCTSDDVGNSSWHGTHVASLIAASTNNGLGMAGVAWNVKLLPVRALGKCGGYDSDIMAGMLWAAGLQVPGLPLNPNPARVINMSLGGTGSCSGSGSGTYPGTISQVTTAGTTIVVAAGNSEGEAVGVPGNCSGVITVAALRQVGTKVGFSSIGSQVTLAAPGGNCVNVDPVTGAATGPCLYPILAASNPGAQGPSSVNNYYDSGFGTSYSTPLVSGTVALMLSVQPQLTPADIKNLLQQTARAFPTTGGTAGISACHAPTSTAQDECYCTTSTCGAGMLDTNAAVAAVQATNAGSVAIAVSPASGATVGQTITLSATASLGTGRSVASWSWTLVDGGGAVTGFASGASTATATLMPTAAGVITVKATATDDLGLTYSMNSTITVAAAASSGGTSAGSSSSGGGGGGAFSPLWLLGLMLACLLLTKKTRPQRG